MNKLKLQLDDLQIESFNTTAAAQSRGTVVGEQCTCYTQCTCQADTGCGPTCNASCHNSCVAYETCDVWTCGGTCAYDTCNCGSGGGNTSLC